jgi:mannose-1-phosphate guanylyltransferase/mannose-6-phosphate isomerase
VSREALPKQFADLFGGLTTFQCALQRAASFGRPLIVANVEHRLLVMRQMADIGIDADVLLEPTRRDSGPAVLAACTMVAKDHDGLALVMPADHMVASCEGLLDAVRTGLAAALAGRLVVFGVRPTAPETGYGYIESGKPIDVGVREVTRFWEKPGSGDAERCVAAGMLWNSGNFLFLARALIDEYRRYEPTATAIESAVENGKHSGNVSVIDAGYADAVARSLDYAVMERTRRAAVVHLEAGWSDIGSWNALWEIGTQDEAGNVVRGDVELIETEDCYVAGGRPLVCVVGQKNLAVICTEDAVLVADRNAGSTIKMLVDRLRKRRRPEAQSFVDVQRPWGRYRVNDRGDGFQVKRITVAPGGRLSLQRHRHRAEHWVVVSGEATVTVNADVWRVLPSEHVHIPLGAVHRLENFGSSPLELIEVQTGGYLGEDDIERLEDVYERA